MRPSGWREPSIRKRGNSAIGSFAHLVIFSFDCVIGLSHCVVLSLRSAVVAESWVPQDESGTDFEND
jgi:hypothetical protein